MYNPWLSRAKVRSIKTALSSYIGGDYLEVAYDLNISAAHHPDWKKDKYSVHITVNDVNIIESLEIRELEMM